MGKLIVDYVAKLRPLLFDMASVKYWSLGPAVGNCWNVGKSLKNGFTSLWLNYVIILKLANHQL
jgi:hypothetical protein